MGSFLSGKTGEEKFHIWTGCHGKNTGIMMSNGLIKKVQDIKKGDFLMGPDSKPRRVLNLVRGKSDMYRIKKGNESFIINDNHILVLKAYNIVSQFDNKKLNHFYGVLII